MIQKMWLAILATIIFAVPALVALSNGFMEGRWNSMTFVYIGLALLSAAEAFGASDHATRDEAEERHPAS
jgi:ABC-type proline/glycine betaine transport system permease subunit